MKKSRFNIEINNGQEYLLTNTMTGSIVKLSADEWLKYKKSDYTNELLVFLKENGFLVENDVDELLLLKKVFSFSQNDKKNARITICPTLECNFKCPYCYEKRINGYMTERIQDLIIGEIEKLYNCGIEKIFFTWYGGEPLLYPDIIYNMSKRIVNIAKSSGKDYEFNIITNGYLIDDETIRMFKIIGMSNIQITIDGDKKTHDERRKCIDGTPTYEIIKSNIEKLVRNSFRVNVRVNVDKSNVECYEEVKKIFGGNSQIKCYPAFVTEETLQSSSQRNKCFHQNEYGKVIKSYNIDYDSIDLDMILQPEVSICMAEHEYSFVYSFDGSVYKCINDICIPEKAIRNLESIFVNKETETIYLERDPFSEEECNECKYLPMCYGRCTWEYHNKKTHGCPDIKYLLEDILRFKFLKKEVNKCDSNKTTAEDAS